MVIGAGLRSEDHSSIPATAIKRRLELLDAKRYSKKKKN
jgi:hypothetical protein